MNLVLLFNEDFVPGTNRVRLEGRRLAHIHDIHGARVGDVLTVGLSGGNMGQGRIVSMDRRHIDMDVTLDTPPPAGLDLNIILALPRPKVLNRLLMWSASMGIKKLWLIHAQRVEKSYWQSPRLTEENIHTQSVLGLEQAKDTQLPRIVLKHRFKPFVEDELPAIMEGTHAIVAHPTAENVCPSGIRPPLTLAIGPEGGFIPYEVNKLIDCGFKPVHLGSRIFRVETVLPYLVGRLGF